MRQTMALATTALLLAGCASGGPTGEQILAGAAKPSLARLIIYRVSPMGMAVQPAYQVDGKSVGNSVPNGFIVCELKPGPHNIAVENPSLNVNFFGGSDKASVTLAAGTTTFLSAQPQPGLTMGIITLSQVTEAQGRADVASLHKVESSCQ